jgi:L-iditol 2-dehydrogenase
VLASILVSPGKIELRETPTPTPSRGEVLIKIRAALTCGTDLKAFLRGHPVIPMPGLFGHEFSGVIAEAGKQVKGFKTGDEVMAVHSAPCQKCSFCRKKLYNLCEEIMKTKVLGAFAEYIVLPAAVVKQNMFIKPSRLSFEEAAFLEPLSCVVHGMSLLKDIGRNDRILIIGAGPIGLLHLLLAKLKRSGVIITGLEQRRLDVAKRLGADVAVDPSGLETAIEEFTGGLGADVVFECTGQPGVWQKSVEYVRKGGTVILFGGCKSGTKVTYDASRLHYDEIALRGTFHFNPQDVRVAYGLLKKINISSLISGRYPLKDLNIPFEKLSKGEGIKYAIIP